MTVTYRTRHSSISYCKQPSYTGGLYPADPATVAETAGGSRVTVTVAAGIIASDTDHVGQVLECVRATNAANRGVRVMIRAASSAANTLTVDCLPANVTIGDVFLLLVTPDAPAVLSAVGAAGNLIAANRGEANDYWTGNEEEGGYYVEVVNADNHPRSYHPRVTGWTQATSTATVTPSHATASVAGDLCRFLKHADVLSSALVTPEIPEIVRESVIGGYGRERGEQGLRASSGSYELPLRGPGTGRAGLKNDLFDWLDCVFAPTLMASDIEIDAGSAIDLIQYAAGTPVNGVCAMTTPGDAFVISQLDAVATSFVPSPSLRSIPLTGSLCTGGYTFHESATTRRALTFYQWDGNHVETTLWGGVPSFVISGAKGEFTKITASVAFADWYRRYLDVGGPADPAEREWYPRLPKNQSLMSKDVRLVFADTIEFPCTSFSIDLGPELAEDVNLCSTNETDGMQVVQVAPKITLSVRLDSTTQAMLTEVINRGVQRMAIQVGKVPGQPGVLFFWADKVSISSSPIRDDGGMQSLEMVCEVVRDETGLAAGLPQWCLYLA